MRSTRQPRAMTAAMAQPGLSSPPPATSPLLSNLSTFLGFGVEMNIGLNRGLECWRCPLVTRIPQSLTGPLFCYCLALAIDVWTCGKALRPVAASCRLNMVITSSLPGYHRWSLHLICRRHDSIEASSSAIEPIPEDEAAPKAGEASVAMPPVASPAAEPEVRFLLCPLLALCAAVGLFCSACEALHLGLVSLKHAARVLLQSAARRDALFGLSTIRTPTSPLPGW